SVVSGETWSYITYNGTNGYVMTKFLSSTPPSGGSAPQNQSQAFGSYTLKQGQTSYYVKNLQLALRHAGYLNDSADGIFGTNTYNAVVSFQSAKGLTVDGLVGSGTKTKLWELYGSWLMSNGVMGL
ncbi:MAG: peptidoglycan-binding domain-containing protein, partial [Clostridia bacterium]